MNPQFNQRGLLSLRFFVGIGMAFVFIFSTAYFFYGLVPLTQGAPEVKFQITKGDSLKEIGDGLVQKSLIKSAFIFKLYALLSGKAQKFQPGLYDLNAAMSIPQIVNSLVAAGKDEAVVAVPDGSTLKDIDDILSAAKVIEKNSLVSFPAKRLNNSYPFLINIDIDSLEGFLMPDTYHFKMYSSVDQVLEKVLGNFQNKAWPLLVNNADWYRYLTLASFLEREVPKFEDRQMVAGIILKRLLARMPLQIDATVTYVKCGGRLKNCPNPLITKDDLTLNSAYNTYKNLGWTPTPISNPSVNAIQAALTSKASPYWYYLSSKNGETIFSKNLDTHNLNRAKYL
ncbi:hypothetical protein COV54_02735 [Candidatus Jorgensenbacteria bacterium CG11_big_fil_rev_8_21_14_0_20_38_23]|uniref:Endolytic murein transglycosylase n=2 Tax=Candidatus Joergenseniibacteriota TaxID=1752739 RepID=A0A2H0NDY5_9BACT|nr:MAG: hypothetical protein COV54_02735 [Candidatus Jorgensenbacteria bacterium CG11_big_fil_rev_8_21_14_0_20_38_23]